MTLIDSPPVEERSEERRRVRPADVLWHRRSRFVRRLAVFALVNAVLVTLPLRAFPQARIDWPQPRHTLSYALRYLTFGTNQDSWWPMAEAARYLAEGDGSGRTVYEAVFFDAHVKFQYPLTSLLPLELGGIPADPSGLTYLNLISWIAVWVNALFVVLIFFEALRRHTPHLLPRRLGDKALLGAVVGAMAMTFFPISTAAVIGQIQVWINCLAAILVWAWMTRRHVVAGIAGGLVCAIKPQIGLLLVWALLRRRYRFSAAFAATIGLLGVLSIGVYGLRENLAYLDVLGYMSRHGETFFNNQTVNGLLNRLFDNGSNLLFDSASFSPWNPAIYLATAVSSLVLILGAVFWRRREHGKAGTVDLCIAMIAFTMASPIAWDFHYGILMPIYAVLLPALLRRPVWGRWTIGLLALSYVLSSNYFDALLYAGRSPWSSPAQSMLLFSAVFVLVTAVKARRARHDGEATREIARSSQPARVRWDELQGVAG